MKIEVITRQPENNPRHTPILFVHGMFHCARCWDEYFLPYFAQHCYPAYALSLRGHGNSEGRDRLRWATLGDYLTDLDQVINQLPIPPVLVGHSMGGLLVQNYLQKQEVPAAVLLGAVSPNGLLPVSMRVLIHNPLTFMKAILTLRPYYVVGNPGLYRELFFSSDVSETKLATCFSRVHDESFLAYLGMLFAALNPPRPISRTPLLVLGGASDTSITPGEVELTARKHRTRAELFPHMAHAMMLEDDWQVVADRILGWLDELQI
jgi:pimeloyl-ACP methyl ester carboxylesterase